MKWHLLSILIAVGCNGSVPHDGNIATDTRADSVAPEDETCSAVFHWLQKDAYKSTAGRTSELWPPHTTTTLEVWCTPAAGGEAQQVASAYRENHGTAPGAVDANGQVILVDVKQSDPVQGTRADLLQLVDAYRQCECAPATKFLSLDSLQDDAIAAILQEVGAYLSAHLTCDGTVDTAQLVSWLQAGLIEPVVAALPSCTWEPGYDLNDGMNAAAAQVLDDATRALAGYHVCNNDAELQSAIFDAFRSDGTVGACDNTSPLCSGPRWFYQP
jgi:hypothetical protein